MSAWLPVQPDEIPAELRSLGWVLWRAEQRGEGKPTKVPYRINDPHRRASSTDPETWGAFDAAVETYHSLAAGSGACPGIGCVLTLADRVTCIDLDRVLEGDTLDPRARTVIKLCNDSWTERSPGGNGLHVFVRGAVDEAMKGDQFECYSTARFIAVTGHRWPGTSADLRDAQAYLARLANIRRASVPPRRAWTGSSEPPPDDLAGALLARLQRWGIPGTRLKRWAGGFLVELETCPWADEHTSGNGGAAVAIHPSGALDFFCLHSHCAHRDWRDFRARMETA